MNNPKHDLETIAFYLKRTAPSDDCRSEIDGACEGLANTIQNLQARVSALEKELAQSKTVPNVEREEFRSDHDINLD